MCYSAIEVIMPDGSHIPYNETFLNGNVFEHMLITGNLSLYIGSLIRRDAYLKIERSHPDLVQEDWDMFLKLAKQGDFISSTRIVAYYRRHDNNTWYRKDNATLMYRNRMSILNYWQHEPAWVNAMNLRWKQYLHADHMLAKCDIDALLKENATDPLLHAQAAIVAMQNKDTHKLKQHLLQAIIYCDPRLEILPTLYLLAMKNISEENIRSSILTSLKQRLPDQYPHILASLSQVPQQ